MSLAAALREIRPTLTLAAPIIVGQVSQMLMGVLDSAMIGHAGTVPLAASAFANNVFNVFYVLGIGLMVPVAIFVSRARGAQQPREAAEYLLHGIAMALAFGAVETVAMAALSPQLHRFNQPPEVLAIVTPFYLLFAASLTPVLVYLVLRQFAEAMGHPWAPMFIMLGSVALNAGLNWVLIYGNLGSPALGLTGAGIATLLSRVLGAMVIFLWLRRDAKVRDAWPSFAKASEGTPSFAKPTEGTLSRAETTEGTPSCAESTENMPTCAEITENPPPLAGTMDGARSFPTSAKGRALRSLGEGGFSRARFEEMLRIGLPAAGMLVFEATAFAFSGIMMGWLGAVPLAAHQIGISCASLAFMFPLGLSMAVGIRVSHVVGSGERTRLRPIGFGSLGLGVAVMTGFALIFGFGGKTLARWFVHDAAVVVLAAQLLLVGAFFQLVDGVQVIAAHLLRGISDVKIPTLITLIAYWGIALPLGYALGIRGPFGATGVWTGIACGLAFAAVFLTVRFARLTRLR